VAIRISSHLKRNRFGVFYFRRAIPFVIAAHFQQREIYRSLGTCDRRDAIMRSQAFGAVTDLLFRKLKSMANKKNKPIQQDMVFELDLDGFGSIKMDMEADEIEAGKAIISHAIDRLAPLMKGQVSKSAESTTLFSVAVQDYLQEFEAGGPRPETVLDYRGDFAQFMQITGDVSVASLKHEELNSLKKKLSALPPNINKAKALRGKTIDEILAMKLPAQSARNVQKKWQRLQSFLDWAEGQGLVEKNYAKGKKPKAPTSSREKFSDDDLGRLFESSHYADALYKEPFQYWVPLIAAFTGARLEEISQLHLADLKRDTETQIWCFDITEDVDEGAGATTQKKLKNQASVRACPVHSRLLAAGLIEYADDLRRRGYDRLFPELSVSVYGKTGDRASEFFTTYRRECGVGSMSGRSSKVFHSFRHTMNARLQRANVAQEVREALIGHTPQSTNVRVYGDKQFLGRLHDDLERLVYSFDVAPFLGSDRNEVARQKALRRGSRKQPGGV
jgi:integrase